MEASPGLRANILPPKLTLRTLLMCRECLPRVLVFPVAHGLLGPVGQLSQSTLCASAPDDLLTYRLTMFQ